MIEPKLSPKPANIWKANYMIHEKEVPGIVSEKVDHDDLSSPGSMCLQDTMTGKQSS